MDWKFYMIFNSVPVLSEKKIYSPDWIIQTSWICGEIKSLFSSSHKRTTKRPSRVIAKKSHQYFDLDCSSTAHFLQKNRFAEHTPKCDTRLLNSARKIRIKDILFHTVNERAKYYVHKNCNLKLICFCEKKLQIFFK